MQPDIPSSSPSNPVRQVRPAIVLLGGFHLALVLLILALRITNTSATNLDVHQFLVSSLAGEGVNNYITSGRLTAPFYAASYGPIFYISNYGVIRLFGESITAVKAWLGLCFVILLISSYRLFGRLGGTNRAERFIQTSLLTCMLSTTFMMGQVRPDVPAIMWFVIALNAAIQAVRRPNFAFHAAVLGLAIPLCLFDKQNYVLSAHIPFAYIFIHRRWNVLGYALASTLIGTAAVWGLSSWVYSHADWVSTLLLPKHNFPLAIRNVYLAILLNFRWTGTAPIVITFAYLAARFFRSGAIGRLEPDSRRDLAFLAFWLVSAFLGATFVARAAQSSAHYFMEFGVALIALAGFLYKHIEFGNRRILEGLVALSLVGGMVGDMRHLRGEYFIIGTYAYQQELVDILKSFTPADEPVVSFSSDIPLRAGRKIYFLDDGAYVNYDDYGAKLPELYGKFDEYFANKAFSAFLLTGYRFAEYFTEQKMNDHGYVRVTTVQPKPERGGAPDLYLRADIFEKYSKSRGAK